MCKQLLLYIFGIAVAFGSCKKPDDNLFNKTADERLTESLSSYQKTLTQAPGWKVFVYPQGLKRQDVEVGGVTYYMKFTDSNRVTMVSDFSTDMAATPKESGFRLKAVQRPSLYFDTYSYIHVPADPDPNVSFSPVNYLGGGYGWGTDFEFAFADMGPSDTIHLKGNFNHSDGVMIKATQAEMNAAFSAGKLKAIMDSTSSYAFNNSFLYFPGSNNASVGIKFDFYLTILSFYFKVPNGTLATVNAPFSHTVTGIHLKDPVEILGYTFQDLIWDPVKLIYYFMTGGKRVEITNSASPIFPLYQVIGNSFTYLTVPTTALPGQSSLFTTKYNAAKSGMKTGPYNLDLDIMDFIFLGADNVMILNITVRQNGTPYLVTYQYGYQIDNAGIVKFTRIGQNGNGSLIENNMRNLLDYIEADHFQLDYFISGGVTLGQLTSQERPAFYFTGNLR
jgi:hypothetical protein